ncbi:hypothetical protein N9140_00795, partial [bacterium]|nr:hypothetical protein [bacterium]
MYKNQDVREEQGEHHRYHHVHDSKYEGMMIKYDEDGSTHEASSERHLQVTLPTPTFNGDECPPERQVVCVNGMTNVNGTTVTCAEACGGECCRGDKACDFFYGTVCKDGVSCSDDIVGSFRGSSCYKANITTVLRGCYGYRACYFAGRNDGYIGSITNGCNGDFACDSAAYNGGYIGSITNGCNGNKPCSFAAFVYGSIGNITNGCDGDYACNAAALYDGYIGSITNGCYGRRACYLAANNGGYIGSIT